jgi:predicted Zn-dependent protease
MSTVEAAAVPALIDTFQAAKMPGAGFVGLTACSTLLMQQDGLLAFNRETDSECTVSAWSPDGRASGWFGQASRDWSAVHPTSIAAEAIEMAKRATNPSAVEPGRRTVILSRFALAQMLRHLAPQFDAYQTNVYSSTALAVRGDPARPNKIGRPIFDPVINIRSDPADPLGGFTPFGDMTSDWTAMPTRAVSLVERGMLRDLAYSIYYGLEEGKPFSQNPWSMRVEATVGTPLLTVEQMIANCEEGIYIHRLSDVTEIDRVTGMQTGVTRDGCFLIKNGKIERPVKNFRFIESPFGILNRIIAIGKSERTAFGYTTQTNTEPQYASEWPRRPLIVPPLMIRDFNLTALSDAV